uniref:G_PROTEIN_RECEP_F1_2 domain-containing protein n=1 Tax=Steinernema glaseri TaxID=37863 RepID=A0A1I7XY55_9BILA
MSLLEHVFNRTLDVIAVFSVFSYSVTFFIIIRHTPKSMKAFSLPLINIFIWNAIVNALFIFARPFPMMPLACFKLTGFITLWVDSEIIGQGTLMITFLVMVNVGTALVISFSLRYITIAQWKILKTARKVWFYLYGAILHVVFSAGYLWSYHTWSLSVDHYPEKIPKLMRKNLFCVAPEGENGYICILYLFFFMVFVANSLMVFVGLSFYELHKHKKIVSERTARMQKKLLWNLIMLSGVPLLLGSAPYFAFSVFVFKHDWPYAQLIGTFCTLCMLNYGPTMCVACLLLFKNYRKALKGLFVKKPENLVTVTPVISMKHTTFT